MPEDNLERPEEHKIVDVKVKKEVEFPQDPEKRFEAVFSAIGNSEAKCLTLLCLTSTPITPHDLHKRFLENSGRVWISGGSIQGFYCRDSLIPIGLVAEYDFIPYGATEHVTGFKLTEAGLKYGQPVAAFLLEKSLSFSHTFSETFGATATGPGKSRSVLNRAKILELLSQASTTKRRADLANQLGLNEVLVGQHLKRLSLIGLVEYSSLDLGEDKGLVVYKLSDDANIRQVKSVRSSQILTTEIAKLLFELKRVDVDLLTERLKKKYPKSTTKSLKDMIRTTLAGLATQGICKREVFEGKKVQSQARITPRGEELVSQVLLPIKRVLSGDESLLAIWRMIPWQNYSKKAISRHKEASGHIRQRPLEEWIEKIFTFIRENPGVRPSEIRAHLNHGTSEILKILLDKELVKRKRQGKAVRYYPQEVTN